ncbi:SDR family oxidoreductase [Parafrankia sp. BMG5.11]|uniref:SDR family oxidoreductase n=1 Tax=Parafrankia sp. BMG5.11 TaxID=222540 RepID=UPI00103A53DA|nr:SDR family oxidoreductase [Parafrankia sp. BMG5.11]TCJ37037.1 SDR family oxidoreductase [Parafrankia sp. BMG5.11]
MTGVPDSLAGKAAVVTGGTRGLGRAIAAALAGAGCKVLVCARSEPADPDSRISYMQADIREPDGARAVVERCVSNFGSLDILVNNAGGSPQAEAAVASPRFFDAIVKLNLGAPMYMMQAAHASLKAAGGGSIVNIASVSAIRPSPGTAAYGAAKAGLLNLTQSLAQEWGPDGIRVNALIAGLMATETADQTYGDSSAQSKVAASIPMGRMGTGDDLAEAVLWLASDRSRWVSGARINIDGGGERPFFLELLKED